MSSCQTREDQPQERQFPWKAVERGQRKESPWEPAQKLRRLSPSWAPVAAHSADPDVFVHGHHGDVDAAGVSDPKARLRARNSRVIRPKQPTLDLNQVRPPPRAAQVFFHVAGAVGSLQARLQNKPAARAPARRRLPLQTFYVVSACLASIYACVAL